MKNVEGVTYLKIGEVASKLDRTIQTIKIWYEYNEVNNAGLPPYRTDLDKKGTRYWKEEDIPALLEFKDKVQRGMLTDVTTKKWGNREIKNPYGLKRFEKKGEN